MSIELNENKGLNTIILRDEIGRCSDLEELNQYVIPMIKSQSIEWSLKVKEILESTGLKKNKFAELCGVSRPTLDNWLNGSIPKSREKFLRIGLVAGYSNEEMNQLLQRYGRFPALYSKSLEDSICIYVINHGYGDKAIEKYYYILNKIKESVIRDADADLVTDIVTEDFSAQLAEVKDEEELEKFISDNVSIFSGAFHKLYSYININIEEIFQNEIGTKNIYNLALQQNWSSSLRQCVSAINQNKWYPTRNKIISLGLHLSMDHEQIDEMLQTAHMEPLCSKNLFESIIMFILDDASLNDYMNRESEDFVLENLCNYAKEVLSSFNEPQIIDFIREISEEEDAR